MLRIPDHGFRPSVKEHNVQLDTMADWIEGSVAFSDEAISWSDVADALKENNIYRNEDFAFEHIANVWAELDRRQRTLGAAAPYVAHGKRISRSKDWADLPAYGFCLMLSLQLHYSGWTSENFGGDYTAQGELFEQVTAESLTALGWRAHRTGWSKTNVESLTEIVFDVSSHLSEEARPEAIQVWTEEKAKDAGLDIVCSRAFTDGWGGRPLYLLQCASGGNWEGKLASPDLRIWDKLIDFTNQPLRGFAMPFALLKDEFRRSAGRDGMGLFLDRHRLMAPAFDDGTNWLTAPLTHDLLNWTRPRVERLPLDGV
jgi:hypothetical protein